MPILLCIMYMILLLTFITHTCWSKHSEQIFISLICIRSSLFRTAYSVSLKNKLISSHLYCFGGYVNGPVDNHEMYIFGGFYLFIGIISLSGIEEDLSILPVHSQLYSCFYCIILWQLHYLCEEVETRCSRQAYNCCQRASHWNPGIDVSALGVGHEH